MFRLSLLLVALLAPWAAYAACSDHDDCGSCFLDTSCGWCVTDGACMAGNALGPTSSTCRGHSAGDTVYWYYATSQVVSKIGSFPVNPQTTNVYLHPGSPLDVTIKVTAPVPTDQDLDVMFVQDSSGSMSDDINTFQALSSNLVNEILALSKTATVGLSTYVEKPCSPMGKAGNWEYELAQPLTYSALQLRTALLAIRTTGNVDFPEDAFTALSQTLSCASVQWRAGARRVVIVITDARYHYYNDHYTAGKSSCVSDKPAWSVADGCYLPSANVKYPTASPLFNYPTEEAIRSLIIDNEVIPIFAVAHNSGNRDRLCRNGTQGCKEIDYWQDFMDTIGYGVTFELADSATNLVEEIVAAFKSFQGQIQLVLDESTDPAPKVVLPGLTGVYATEFGSGGTNSYTGVEQGETKPFTVSLLSPVGQQLTDRSLLLVSPTYGQSRINVLAEFPCYDCAGTANGGASWDQCGACDGSNLCLGCDNVPNSGKVVDSCGVCGGFNECAFECDTVDVCGVCDGDGTLCLGCDNVANSLAEEDACGVCNGNNACVGCDGEKYLMGNATAFDACGVCGGTGACIGCDGLPYPFGGKAVLDNCGVCGGTNECFCSPGSDKVLDDCGSCLEADSPFWNACMGCDGVLFSGAVYDACGDCNGLNECVSPCDGLAYGEEKDACGVCGGNGTSCAIAFNNATEPPLIYSVDESNFDEKAAVGVSIGVATTLVIIGAAILAFLAYKKYSNPFFFVPEGMLDENRSGVSSNPLFAGQDTWTSNTIAE